MDYFQLFETIKGYCENDFPSTQFSDSTNNLATLTSKEQIDTFIQQAEQRVYNSVQIPAIRKNVLGNVSPNNPYLTLPLDWLATFSVAISDSVTTVNYSAIPAALLAAAVNIEPQKTLFKDTLIGGRPLGDITNDGTVSSADSLEYSKWVQGTQTNQTYISYITNVLNPYMLSNPAQYQAYITASGIGGYEYLLDKDVNFIRAAFPYPSVIGKPTHYAQFDQNTFILGPTPDANYVVELHYYYYPESIVTVGNTWLGDNFDSVLLYGALLEAYAFMKGEKDVNDNYIGRYNEALALLKNLGDGKNRTDAYRTGQVRVPVR